MTRTVPLRLLVVMVAMVAMLTAAMVVAQEDNPPASPPAGPGEDTVRDIVDADGNIINPDAQLAAIAEEQPGGFGGYYFDETDRSIAYVYMRDITQTAAATAAFGAAYDGSRTITQIIPVQGEYAFNDLFEWFDALDTALVDGGVYPTSGAVMELTNRIVFGVRSEADLTSAQQVLRDSEVPEGAVVFNVEVNELLDKGALDEEWRPLVGGIQHQQELYGNKCTIGFGTERDDEEGLVLASHCTSEEKHIGGVDDAVIHQPVNPFLGSNVVATETIDPRLGPMDHPQCDEDYYCRYSDAAFAELDEEEELDLGKVAKPTAIGETDVDPEGTTFSITSENAGIGVGDTVYFVGRTTGWNEARVTDTCSFSEVKAPVGGGVGVRIICVGRAVPLAGSVNADEGDSGSPVMEPGSGDDVSLVGTVFSHSSSGSYFHFSKIGLVYWEIDSAATWDSCTSGC